MTATTAVEYARSTLLGIWASQACQHERHRADVMIGLLARHGERVDAAAAILAEAVTAGEDAAVLTSIAWVAFPPLDVIHRAQLVERLLAAERTP